MAGLGRGDDKAPLAILRIEALTYVSKADRARLREFLPNEPKIKEYPPSSLQRGQARGHERCASGVVKLELGDAFARQGRGPFLAAVP